MPGFTLTPGADVAAAQSELERTLRDVPPGLADRVLIAVGEIVANSAEHGQGSVTITWRRVGGGVEVRVAGPGPDVRQIRDATLPPEGAVRGRGLFLIRTLATRVEPGPDGLLLWFSPV